MARGDKLLLKLLRGQSLQTIRFTDLCLLLRGLGFHERVRGSHHVFHREGIVEILNLQARPDGSAKPYQIRQVRAVLLRYGLETRDV